MAIYGAPLIAFFPSSVWLLRDCAQEEEEEILPHGLERDEQTHRSSVRFLIQNIRSWCELRRHTQPKYVLKSERVDIIGPQETIKHDFSVQELHWIEHGGQFNLNWVPASGLSVGFFQYLEMSVVRWVFGGRVPSFLVLTSYNVTPTLSRGLCWCMVRRTTQGLCSCWGSSRMK
jgi:hypothetical protein